MAQEQLQRSCIDEIHCRVPSQQIPIPLCMSTRVPAVFSRASKTLCLQGLFKFMGFAQILQWRGAFNHDSCLDDWQTGEQEDGWMDGWTKALDLLVAHSWWDIFAHLLPECCLAGHVPCCPTSLIPQSQQVCSVAALRPLLLNACNPGMRVCVC